MWEEMALNLYLVLEFYKLLISLLMNLKWRVCLLKVETMMIRRRTHVMMKMSRILEFKLHVLSVMHRECELNYVYEV